MYSTFNCPECPKCPEYNKEACIPSNDLLRNYILVNFTELLEQQVNEIDFSDDVFGVLIQYPGKYGSIENIEKQGKTTEKRESQSPVHASPSRQAWSTLSFPLFFLVFP